MAYVLAQRGRRRSSALRLILAGVAVAYLPSATTSFLIFQAATYGGDATRLVVFWPPPTLLTLRQQATPHKQPCQAG